MVKSLFNLCLSAVCENRVDEQLACLPSVCKQRLLEFFSSHDQLHMADCERLVGSVGVGGYLTSVCFFLSEQLTDDMLLAIARHNRTLEYIALIDCSKVTDRGVMHITSGQVVLSQLELRASRNLTSLALSAVQSTLLCSVDISSCSKITSDGICQLVRHNRNITSLYLNHCTGLTDEALNAVAFFLGDTLTVLELDFPGVLLDPATTLFHLSQCCPNIRQLSLCRFFESEPSLNHVHTYQMTGMGLVDVDLYGNHFLTLPQLPPTVTRLRLSVCGDEDTTLLIARLGVLPLLSSVHLQLNCKDESWRSVEEANRFLSSLLPVIGSKLTRLQISVCRLVDTAFNVITQCASLIELALHVKHINNKLLRHFFLGGRGLSPGGRLVSLKLCSLRITYRALFAIARGAHCITDLETSHMPCVDDRFLALVADNCHALSNVNFNGCRFITDKGLAALARKCTLKEVRIRATSCTDKSIYLLAEFCPDLEWISHADFSGRPKFSAQALQCLRDSCVQRVIC